VSPPLSAKYSENDLPGRRNAVGIPQSEGTSDEVAGAVIETGHDVSTPVAPTESANNNTGRPTIWDLSSVASCFNVFSFFVNIVYDTTDAHDMKNFINKPVSHPLPYELLSKNILEETPLRHDDLDTIPAVLDVIQGLGNETEPGVVSAKQKEELRRYNANLVFKVGENIVCFRLAFQAARLTITCNRTWTYSMKTDC